MSITRSQIARQMYSRGGNTGYSDYASPSSSTASQDFATQAVSGGQTDYGGGGDNQPISTPRVNPVVNAIQTAGDYIQRGIGYLGQRPVQTMSVLSGFDPISLALTFAANKYGGPRSTGYNPNVSPSMSTANQPYSVMRTGGTFDVPYTGGDNEILPRLPVVAETPTDVNETISDFDLYMQNLRAAQPNPFMLDYRFAAAEGGTPRQAYGLGKLVRKITKPIKKIAKSDIGKAALTAAALYGGAKFLGSPTGAGFKRFIFGSPASYMDKFGIAAKPGILAKLGLTKGAGSMALTGKGLAGLGILGTSALAGLSAAGEEEEDLEPISSREDTSGLKEMIAGYPALRFRVPSQYLLNDATYAAKGGRIGYEEGGNIDPENLPMSKEGLPTYEDIETGEEVEYPYENKEMSSAPDIDVELFQMYLDAVGSGQIPRSTTFDQYKELMNEMSFEYRDEPYGPFNRQERTMANEGGLMSLGGNEMDLRGGGFVPIGKQEKADDVPARLSKNEFVFTADAVRAAGGGDVDKGADLMYKTMKDLESRVG